jgi:hypothetical protein
MKDKQLVPSCLKANDALPIDRLVNLDCTCEHTAATAVMWW